MTDSSQRQNYENYLLKTKIIEIGQKHHVDRFVDDPDPYVREAVAERGFKEHLDKLVHDRRSNVREMVAERGHKEHLDRLVHDENWRVRRHVAKHGHPEHKLKLLADYDKTVRTSAADTSDNETLTKFFNDINSHRVRVEASRVTHVAELVTHARHPNQENNNDLFRAIARNYFVGNYQPSTHLRIAQNTKDPETMEILSRHPERFVRSGLIHNPALEAMPPSPIKDKIMKQVYEG